MKNKDMHSLKKPKLPVYGRLENLFLQHNGGTLAALINASPLAIVALDRSGKVLVWNSAAQKLFGWKEKEILGKNYPLVPDFELDDFQALIDREFSGKRHRAKEMKRLHKNGKLVEISLWTAPMYDKEGDMYAVLGMMADNTEDKKIKEALKQRDEVLIAVGSMAKVGGWEFDITSGKGSWTEEVAKIHEVDPGTEYSLDTGLKFYQGESKQIIEQATREVIEEGKSYDLELELITEKGNHKWIRTIAHPVLEKNKVSKIRGSIQDITDYKHAEQQLHLLGSALYAAVNSIMITDNKGNIVWINPAFTQLTGYEFEEVLNKNPRQLLKSNVHDKAFYKKMWDTMLDGKVWKGEIINQRKNGSLYTEYQTISPVFNEQGEITHFIAIKQDITERKKAEEALRLFRSLIDQTQDTIEIVDPETAQFIDINKKGHEELGYTREEFLGLTVFDIDPMINKAIFDKSVEELRSTKFKKWEGVHKRKDGSTFPVEVNIKFVSLDREYIVTVVRDITERKNTEDKIRRLNRLYRVTSSINTLIVRVNQRDILFDEACNIAVKKGKFHMAWIGTLSSDKKSVVPRAWAGHEENYLFNIKPFLNLDNKNSLYIQAVKKMKPVIYNNIEQLPDKYSSIQKEALRRDYNSIIVMPLIVDQEVAGIISFYSEEKNFFDEREKVLLNELTGDISFALQTISQHEKLKFLSSYDPLTGLPNRVLFNEHLDYVLNLSKQTKSNVAILVFDIRQFRFINNAFGRESGDILLKKVAGRLQKLSADPANVGRITSDYFALILSCDRDGANVALNIQESIIPTLNKPYSILDNDIQIDITVGVSIFPTDGENAEMLYRNAEAALKKAKDSSKKYLFYRPEMTARVAERLLLENKLKHALEKNQFVLFYQPKVDAGTHAITGLEALIRWNDPEAGLIPPDAFIPLLEQNGMITEVGAWAMNKALEDAESWKSENIEPPHIAVNVSALQLQQNNFNEIVEDIVKKHGGKDCLLELEVTESLFMDDIENNIKKLTAIRDLGVSISVDDFGTGYSSLGYLSKLPVNALKIDRSFIILMDKQPDNMTIVSSIITLAHSLRLKVIAEGVETEEQSKLLMLSNCDEMQGYLYSKPVPSDKIPELLLKYQ